jgi:RNA polymerase sigma-70 factor (ECF subfamily)
MLPAMTRRGAEPDLAGLLSQVAKGDRESLAEVYRQVSRPVFAFAVSRLGNREAAADLLHEVMLVVWKRAASFRNQSRPLTWILGIAHHKIIDSLRRAGRWKDDPLDDDAVDEGTPSALELAHFDQRRAAVRAAVASLPDHHRQVVHLAFFEDLSYPEISRILNVPEGTVKTRMYHAKRTLLRRLRPHLEGAPR